MLSSCSGSTLGIGPAGYTLLLGELHLEVYTQSMLAIFTEFMCAHTNSLAHAQLRDEHVDDVVLHTYIHTHTYMFVCRYGDFLV